MDNLDYIDSYFTEEPDQDRSRAFEQKIESDPAFAEEVAFYLNARAAAGEAAEIEKKKHFREVYQKNQAEFKRFGLEPGETAPQTKPAGTPIVRKLIRYFAVAAVISGIILGINIFTSSVSPQQLASQFEKEHLQNLPVTMSSRADSLQTGLRLYNDGQLPQALQQFETIIRYDTSNFLAMKYAGFVSLRMKDYNKAISYFHQLEIQPGLYSNPGVFYQALTLMKRNQPTDADRAKQMLEQVVKNDLEGKETAEEWLRKLKS